MNDAEHTVTFYTAGRKIRAQTFINRPQALDAVASWEDGGRANTCTMVAKHNL